MPALKTVLVSSVLFCGSAALLCLPLPSAFAQEPINTPILFYDANFRDLAGPAGGVYGGTGYADTTSNGGVMRTGVFYRSMSLSGLYNPNANPNWVTLSSLHIVLDIDLRVPEEINGSPFPFGPDRVPAGAAYVNVNIWGNNPLPSPTPPPAPDSNPYQSFVTIPSMAAAFGTVLLDLAHASGPALYHCSEGKDRTGWTSMLLQTIAGVPQATIMRDYMASNVYLGATMVYQQWLTDGLADINAKYPQSSDPMYAYLTQGLGLTQADIYVLRGKMVYYSELPGQTGFSGNAAAGAAFLNALQNSPLSGAYTAYNYYLQSAIDAGTLWGAETRAGGQIHADTASYLMRQPLWIDGAISPYTTGEALRTGQGRLWVTGTADGFWSGGGAGIANSSERGAGMAAGSTYRIAREASTYAGVVYNSGTVASAGASASVGTAVLTIGGRYGIPSLEAGPYVLGRADAGWAGYESKRALGGGLGTALGDTNGAIYSGLAGAGYIVRMAPFTLTAQTGFRISGVALGGFDETGSELGLGVNRVNNLSPSVLAGLEAGLDRRQLGAWTVEPSVTLAWEHVLGDPRAESTGTLYGYTVSQYSAFDSRDLIKAGLGIAAQHDAFTVSAKGNAMAGDGARSSGAGGQLSVRYAF